MEKRAIRWWPLWLLLGLDLVFLIYTWQFSSQARQNMVVSTMMAQLIMLALVFIWFLFLSRFSGKVRLLGLGLAILLAVAAALTLEIREVTGDIVPIVTWRWTPQNDELLDSSAKTGAVDTTALDDATAFPRFLGPNGDAKLPATQINPDWLTAPPIEKWRQPIGAGWSAFSVLGNLAVTQEQRGEEEMVTCYDLNTGSLLWSHGDRTRYSTTLGGTGPRATPTIADNRVYSIGAKGILNCLDLATGARIWSVEAASDNGGIMPQWGYSCSPLVVDDLVVVSPGGPNGKSLVAYHKETGAFVWGGGNDEPGYSSPVVHTVAGIRQILILNAASVAGHDVVTGKLLWEQSWGRGYPQVANPVPVSENAVLVSSGYGVGAKRFELSGAAESLQVEEIFTTPRLKAKFANYVIHDGWVYGLDDGVLTCIDPNTGERKWKRGRYGHGQILLVGNHLLVQSEEGSLVLVEPNPDEHRELADIPVLSGKAWNNMALAGNRLLMRNHQEAVCLELTFR